MAKRRPRQKKDLRQNATVPRARARPRGPGPELTDALSVAERRILLVYRDSNALKYSTSKLCLVAGVNRATFYRLKGDPDFQRKRAEIMAGALRDCGPVLHALRKSAMIEGRDGSQDRKLLLEIAGLYRPRLAAPIEQKRSDLDDMPDEVALHLYLAYAVPRERWIPSIRQAYEQGRLKPRQADEPLTRLNEGPAGG